MLTRLQKFREQREDGFTLIEIIIVIVIIGIISAIAIPSYLNHQKAAIDATVESDVISAVIAVEAWMVKNHKDLVPVETYKSKSGNATAFISPAMSIATQASTNGMNRPDIKVSNGNTIIISNTNVVGAFCVFGVNTSGDKAARVNGITYDSTAGGMNKLDLCGDHVPSEVGDLIESGGKNDPIAGGENGDGDNKDPDPSGEGNLGQTDNIDSECGTDYIAYVKRHTDYEQTQSIPGHLKSLHDYRDGHSTSDNQGNFVGGDFNVTVKRPMPDKTADMGCWGIAGTVTFSDSDLNQNYEDAGFPLVSKSDPNCKFYVSQAEFADANNWSWMFGGQVPECMALQDLDLKIDDNDQGYVTYDYPNVIQDLFITRDGHVGNSGFDFIPKEAATGYQHELTGKMYRTKNTDQNNAESFGDFKITYKDGEVKFDFPEEVSGRLAFYIRGEGEDGSFKLRNSNIPIKNGKGSLTFNPKFAPANATEWGWDDTMFIERTDGTPGNIYWSGR